MISVITCDLYSNTYVCCAVVLLTHVIYLAV